MIETSKLMISGFHFYKFTLDVVWFSINKKTQIIHLEFEALKELCFHILK